MNLGNTCYANSVIQVLHKIPELEEGVESVADVDSGSWYSWRFSKRIEENLRSNGSFAVCSETN